MYERASSNGNPDLNFLHQAVQQLCISDPVKQARSTSFHRPEIIQLYQLHVLGKRVLNHIEYEASAFELFYHCWMSHYILKQDRAALE